jgi:(R,R)-butanediol dehydrogenase / meso-butanediol dehydrogenase / diacetyl reductase
MSTRRGGTVVQTGPHIGPAEVRPMVWSENELTIAGTWCYHVYDWPRIAAMIERGSFPVERIVTSRIDLEETVPAGFEVLVDPRGSEIKVLVELT